jgi:hypothetical protein
MELTISGEQQTTKALQVVTTIREMEPGPSNEFYVRDWKDRAGTHYRFLFFRTDSLQWITLIEPESLPATDVHFLRGVKAGEAILFVCVNKWSFDEIR